MAHWATFNLRLELHRSVENLSITCRRPDPSPGPLPSPTMTSRASAAVSATSAM